MVDIKTFPVAPVIFGAGVSIVIPPIAMVGRVGWVVSVVVKLNVIIGVGDRMNIIFSSFEVVAGIGVAIKLSCWINIKLSFGFIFIIGDALIHNGAVAGVVLKYQLGYGVLDRFIGDARNHTEQYNNN